MLRQSHPPIGAILVVLALGGIGCRVQPVDARGKLDQLIRQVQGDGCAYASVPGSPPACKTRDAGAGVLAWLLLRSDIECVQAAAHCLAEMGADAVPAVPALIEAASHGPNNYDTGDGTVMARDAIVEALGATGDLRALPVLLQVLQHPKPMDLGPGATGASVPRKPVGEEAALRALARMGPRAATAVPAILPFLDRPFSDPIDRRVVEAAATALSLIGDPAAIPSLTKALARPETAPRVAEALGRFGPAARESLPALVTLIEAEPDRTGETLIRQAIVHIGGATAAESLPLSYYMQMNRIWRLAKRIGARQGVRFDGVHFNEPKQEIVADLRDGGNLTITFARDAWVSERVAEGSVAVRRPARTDVQQRFQGLPQLERRLESALAEQP